MEPHGKCFLLVLRWQFLRARWGSCSLCALWRAIRSKNGIGRLHSLCRLLVSISFKKMSLRQMCWMQLLFLCRILIASRWEILCQRWRSNLLGLRLDWMRRRRRPCRRRDCTVSVQSALDLKWLVFATILAMYSSFWLFADLLIA